MVADGAEKAFDPNGKHLLVVTWLASIAAMANKRFGCGTTGAALRSRKSQIGKLVSITLDIGTKIGDNNHTGWWAWARSLVELVRLRPISFLA